MLKLYTNKSKFGIDKVLYGNDGIFSDYIKSVDFNADEKYLERDFMLKYDGAVILGNNAMFGPLMQTKYGVTHITNLSTGLKTLLNLMNFKEIELPYQAVDVTECGENILLDIFLQAERLDVPVILEHSQLPAFNGLQIMVDEAEIVSTKTQLAQIIRMKEGTA